MGSIPGWADMPGRIPGKGAWGGPIFIIPGGPTTYIPGPPATGTPTDEYSPPLGGILLGGNTPLVWGPVGREPSPLGCVGNGPLAA